MNRYTFGAIVVVSIATMGIFFFGDVHVNINIPVKKA